jgi:response regulator of citrate/malate metabolism
MKKYAYQIIDHDNDYRDTARNYMEEVAAFELCLMEKKKKNSPEYFQFIASNTQLIILDPDSDKTFYELWKEKLSKDVFLIIQSYSSSYALEAYTNHVVDYLVKPYTRTRFLRAINRFIKRAEGY